MLWLYFTLLAVIIWSIVNINDKYIVCRYVKNPSLAALFVSVLGSIAALIIIGFVGIMVPGCLVLFMLLLGGVLYVLSNVFYFKAILIEEASRVIALFSITPIFVLIISTVFLGEIFEPIKYAGILLVIAGSFLISLKKGEKLMLSRALVYMVSASILIAGNYVIIRFASDFVDYWSVFFWTRIGAAFTIPFFVYFFSKPLISMLKKSRRGSIYMFANEGINTLGAFFMTIALSIGFASIVTTLGETQPLFILLFATLVSIYKPWILKEELKHSIFALKAVAIIITVIGAVLLV